MNPWLYMLTSFALSALLIACNSTGMEVIQESDKQRIARTAYDEALQTFAKTPESLEAYAIFVRRAEEVRAELPYETQSQIELHISFFVMSPLSKAVTFTAMKQLDLMATTVWPAFLRNPLLEGESVRDYLQRVCRTDSTLNCTNMATELQISIVNAKVFRIISFRAQSAYSACPRCQKDRGYLKALDEFSALATRVGTTALGD